VSLSPSHIRVCELVDVEPPRETRPLGRLSAVDGDAPLDQLVLARLQVRNDLRRRTINGLDMRSIAVSIAVATNLLRDLGEVLPTNHVVRLQEYLPQSALT
jgi:hypothetical protein